MRKYILGIMLLMLALSCSDRKARQEPKEPAKTEEKEGIGLYVYLDISGVLHTKNGCTAVYKDHNRQEVKPVHPTELKMWNLKRVCSQCVTEHQLIELEALIEAQRSADALETDTVAVEYDPDTDDPDNTWGY